MRGGLDGRGSEGRMGRIEWVFGDNYSIIEIKDIYEFSGICKQCIELSLCQQDGT